MALTDGIPVPNRRHFLADHRLTRQLPLIVESGECQLRADLDGATRPSVLCAVTLSVESDKLILPLGRPSRQPLTSHGPKNVSSSSCPENLTKSIPSVIFIKLPYGIDMYDI